VAVDVTDTGWNYENVKGNTDVLSRLHAVADNLQNKHYFDANFVTEAGRE